MKSLKIMFLIFLFLGIPLINAEVSFNINAPDTLKYKDEGVVEFIIVNNFDKEIYGKIVVTTPYDIEVCGGDFDFSGGNSYVSSFSLKPGEGKTLMLKIKNKADEKKKAIILAKATYNVDNKTYILLLKKIISLDYNGLIPDFEGSFSERLLYYLTGCWYYLVATISSLIAMYMAYREVREKKGEKK